MYNFNNNKKAILGEIVFTEKNINIAIKKYADVLNKEFKSKTLTIIIILNGAVFFGIKLLDNLNVDLEIDFLAVSSYEGKIKKKEIKLYKNIKIDLKNKDVLIIEDIIDSGKTLTLIYNFINKFNPNSIKVCSLIKIKNSKVVIPDKNWTNLLELNEKVWLVGFGLDYNEKYRNLKDVYVLNFKKII